MNSHWGVAGVALAAALAGDTATERRARTALERIILVEGRTPERTTLDATFAPLAMERLGELYEQQGNAARAAEYYARFAELWKDADAELQPRVRRARERAAALLAPSG